MVDTVPFFVFRDESNDTIKALFSIPPTYIPQIVLHPVVCRGSYFVLKRHQDDDEDGNNKKSGTTMKKGDFVAAQYQSVDPDGTAAAIARRLASRLRDCYNSLKQYNDRHQYHNTIHKNGMSRGRSGVVAYTPRIPHYTNFVSGNQTNKHALVWGEV
jgi:hypothetical protein